MDMLLEKPFTIAIAAITLLMIVFYFWTQTRIRKLLYFLVAIVLGGILLLLVERSVKTDREQIRETLTELAVAVGNNDKETVMTYFAAGEQTDAQRAKASNGMDKYIVDRCRVSRFEPFEVPAVLPGETKRCTLTVFVAGVGRYGQHSGNGASEVTLKMIKDANDQWKIEDFDFTSPLHRHVGHR